MFSLVLSLVLAAPAMAHDNGEGLAGETDDKVITFFSLGVVIFFVVIVVLGSILQNALEKRKEERKTAALRQRIGW
jgi:nitrogen fixation/metabolism regulation signal transduction histidine kinase